MTKAETIIDLETTTFSGRRFTRAKLQEIVETVEHLPGLSRNELALTLCENLSWKAWNGKFKVHSCQHLLDHLQRRGLISLPEKRATGERKHQLIGLSAASNSSREIKCTLEEIGEVDLRLVSSSEELKLWNEYVARYHYLGYQQPVGNHLRYFVVAKNRDNERLGCLLFGSSAYALKPRDEWIGWKLHHRIRRLKYVVCNSRFLIFPWVNVPNLASKALSLTSGHLARDWKSTFGHRPVLVETFVDSKIFRGTCYQAASWQFLGHTSGRSRGASKRDPSIKDIYVLPLDPGFRAVLRGEKTNHRPQTTKAVAADSQLTAMWTRVMGSIADIAQEYDEGWQQRNRVISSMMLVLLAFRLVSSRDRKGYGSTIDEMWDNCHKSGIELPQEKSIAASSFAEARLKLNESIFRRINDRIIAEYAAEHHDGELWHGRRIYAVDGSKIFLPRQLLKEGYKLPHKSYYPQGLLSTLYRLKTMMPVDFDLVKHYDERRCAINHLVKVERGDVVVYDRGYFSYEMVQIHLDRGVHGIFRLKNHATIIKAFFKSDAIDTMVDITPSKAAQKKLKKQYPEKVFGPLKVRLIKYRINDAVYCLGTTLMDESLSVQEFQEVYHARWGVEELYKTSKQILLIEEFHARGERGVRQELYAHFNLITMSRVFANHADRVRLPAPVNGAHLLKSRINQNSARTNIKNCLGAIARHLEGLTIAGANFIRASIAVVEENAIRRAQKLRPGRSYERRSKKPRNKWQAPARKAKPSPA